MREMELSLPENLNAAVQARVAEWQLNGKVERLWARDASLWTDGSESSWLGWLDIVGQQGGEAHALLDFALEVVDEGFTDVVVLGMGGSSLCPEVLAKSFGPQEGRPRLQILDSTDPGQVLTLERGLDLETTLFIVSSKSGSTLEPNVFLSYFLDRVRQHPEVDDPGQHFVAITDPGSALQGVAEREGFRRIFFGVPEIGGRFSALSNFGMVPAAVMGLDQGRLLARAEAMSLACAETGDSKENPGLLLGALIGESQRLGRDKLTLLCSPGIWDLGAWLEQLIAESTGKEGKAVIPVDREKLDLAEIYGRDRLSKRQSIRGALQKVLRGLPRQRPHRYAAGGIEMVVDPRNHDRGRSSGTLRLPEPELLQPSVQNSHGAIPEEVSSLIGGKLERC